MRKIFTSFLFVRSPCVSIYIFCLHWSEVNVKNIMYSCRYKVLPTYVYVDKLFWIYVKLTE
jgi:hypothetical protein